MMFMPWAGSRFVPGKTHGVPARRDRGYRLSENSRGSGCLLFTAPFSPSNQDMPGYNQDMLDWSQCPEVERSPERVSGSWVFRGSRVPVQALFENLEEGASIEDFLLWFPGVERKQVEAVLEYARQSLSEIPGR